MDRVLSTSPLDCATGIHLSVCLFYAHCTIRTHHTQVDGVQIYISDFRRPLAERLAKDFFSDPSQAAVACVRTGPVTMKGVRGPELE